MEIEDKEESLIASLEKYGSIAVAFSGGVDSSYLCAVAVEALGAGSVAITIDSPLIPRSEIEDARRVAAMVGIAHTIIREERIDDAVAANPPDRCYYCKRLGMATVSKAAAELGIRSVAEGSNIDDLADYRPGRRASRELGIAAPLADAGLTKADIRELSRRRGLPTWDKPAFACLASRIPYGDRLDPAALARVEAAEVYLRGRGLRQVRVRSHGDTARIELASGERRQFFSEAALDEVSARLKGLGFVYVCMELEGYSMGSLNKAIDAERIAT